MEIATEANVIDIGNFYDVVDVVGNAVDCPSEQSEQLFGDVGNSLQLEQLGIY